MGLLFSKLWGLFTNEEHKVIIVGLDNAGKTTILYQLKAVLVQEFNGDAVINILQLLRLDLVGGGEDDSDSVEWQCLKNNGVMLTVMQWKALCRSVDIISEQVNKLDRELQAEFA